jgi:hypothetical protein
MRKGKGENLDEKEEEEGGRRKTKRKEEVTEDKGVEEDESGERGRRTRRGRGRGGRGRERGRVQTLLKRGKRMKIGGRRTRIYLTCRFLRRCRE